MGVEAEIDTPGQVARKRFEMFLQVFKSHAETAEHAADLAQSLIEIVDDPKDGLKAAIDDLSNEVRGLRVDIRTLAKALMRR